MRRRTAFLIGRLFLIGFGLLLSTAASASSYYLWNDYGGNFYDAEKSPNNSEDDLMCWAASASNVLTWTGWARAFSSEDKVFEYFQDHWTDQGGNALYGWEWWFSGTHSPPPPSSGYSYVDYPGGGGFWKDENFAKHYKSEGDTSLAMSSLSGFLRAGYGVVLWIWDGGQGSHQVTAWGYAYDAMNGYLGVYITDSDDGMYAEDAADELRYYGVSFRNGNKGKKWYLSDAYADWHIYEVQGLERYPAATVPVPPAVWLLCSGLIGLACMKFRIWSAIRRPRFRFRRQSGSCAPA